MGNRAWTVGYRQDNRYRSVIFLAETFEDLIEKIKDHFRSSVEIEIIMLEKEVIE